MKTIETCISKINEKLGRTGKTVFLVTFILGILTHLSILVADVPNHDGLDSIYFDQNMITSGRWFLGVACGISSYFSLPWLIGLLAIAYISASAVLLCRLLKVESAILGSLIGALLITFPSVASNFAYVFTMDGYMLGLFLAILSVYLVGLGKYGFIYGAIALSFSMGIYQAYLPIAVLLCGYEVLAILADSKSFKDKLKGALKYLYMGVIGMGLYYIILRVLLALQKKTLDTYQGIDSLSSREGLNIVSTLKKMYVDFFAFTLKGNVLFNNVFGLVASIALFVAFFAALLFMAIKKGWLKSGWFYLISIIVVILVPIFTNIILVISPDVTYHLLMRYQWVFFYIIALSFIGRVLEEYGEQKTLTWITFTASVCLIFTFILTDNVAYSNLQKRYEKTYAYCVRLADRIEQTEGYYVGIPIYMIGVVGSDNFPETDITGKVTDHMIGISGDYLLYTNQNYELFFKHYLGITFNFLRPDEANYYDTPEYIEMNSFPGPDSTRVVNGVLYVKTENMH